MAGHPVCLDLHHVAGLEALPLGRVAAARGAGQRQRESALGTPLQVLQGEHALFHTQRGQARQCAFVVARAQVVARLHALDGVPILVHVENAAPHGVGIECIGAHLPGRVERRRLERITHAAKALAPAEVVSSVHGAPFPTGGRRRSWRRA